MIEATKQDWRVVSKMARNLGYEGDMTFTEDGLELFIMSADTTYAINALFKPGYFTTYQPETDDITVDYTQFDKTFSRFRKKEAVRLKVDDKGYVWHESDRKEFSMRQIDVEPLSEDIPSLDLSTSFEVERAEFNEVLEDAAFSTSENGEIELHITDGIVVKAGEKTSGSYKGVLTKDVSSDEKYKAIFSINILQTVIDGLKTVETVNATVGKNAPMKIIHEDDDFEIEAMIAPRVQKDA